MYRYFMDCLHQKKGFAHVREVQILRKLKHPNILPMKHIFWRNKEGILMGVKSKADSLQNVHLPGRMSLLIRQ